VKIEVETVYAEPKPAGPLKVAIKVNGKLFASAPFAFNGAINKVNVKYIPQPPK